MSLKKLAMLLISLLVIIVLLVIFESSAFTNIINPVTAPQPTPGAYTSTVEGLKVNGENYNDSNGLTAGQKMDAILLAVNNTKIQETIKEYQNISPNRSIGSVIPSDQDYRSGYLGLPSIVNVPMQFGDLPAQEYFTAYVDIKNSTVIGVEDWWPKEAGQIDASIPAGADWYHRLMSPWVNSSDNMAKIEMEFRVIYTPDDARLYPIILDEDNFSKYRNGSSFTAVQYVDRMTSKTTVYDGTKPVAPDWTMNGSTAWQPYMSFGDAILPNYYNEAHPNYCVILKNADNRTIRILNFDIGP